MKAVPLTDSMLTALQLLAAADDHAMVRLYSQWWQRESGGGEVIPTATINALVKRGILKKVGPKRRVIGHGIIPDHWRAVLTPAGLALRHDIAAGIK